MKGIKTIGAGFSGRHNSLNFLRLVLASIVLYDHAVGLSGSGRVWNVSQTSIGPLAVDGFFGISGYLIAGSALRNAPGRYLWQRALRIFPGFWVCLLMTAFVFGVIIAIGDPTPHCGLSCYFTGPQGPVPYLEHNWLLPNQYYNQWTISGTPRAVPFGAVWNGSIWTLFYEFLCYLILLVLGMIRVLRSRVLTLTAALGLWGLIALITFTPSLDAHFNFGRHYVLLTLMKFSAIFLVGAALFVCRNAVPDSAVLAGACFFVFIATNWLPSQGRIPAYSFTAADLFAPLIAYPMLWLGIHLPLQRVGSKNDYSYGIYIYSYPASQLIAFWGLQRFGFAAYIAGVLVLTGTLAAGSWWLIERNALRLKRIAPPAWLVPQRWRASPLES